MQHRSIESVLIVEAASLVGLASTAVADKYTGTSPQHLPITGSR